MNYTWHSDIAQARAGLEQLLTRSDVTRFYPGDYIGPLSSALGILVMLEAQTKEQLNP